MLTTEEGLLGSRIQVTQRGVCPKKNGPKRENCLLVLGVGEFRDKSPELSSQYRCPVLNSDPLAASDSLG